LPKYPEHGSSTGRVVDRHWGAIRSRSLDSRGRFATKLLLNVGRKGGKPGVSGRWVHTDEVTTSGKSSVAFQGRDDVTELTTDPISVYC